MAKAAFIVFIIIWLLVTAVLITACALVIYETKYEIGG